jgi:hypothetical protein
MADQKISALTAATTPLAGTEVLPIVQSGATVKVAVSDLTAGRAIAATSLTTAAVQATNSGGLALKNSGGTTQMTLGSGGGDNITLSVATNITPANAAVAISPTGTGTVAISPAGALTVNPTTASTINNVSIGATTALAGRFTDVTLSTGNVIQGTAAKGINFTANTPAAGMTSQLLNWYEQGTWTPAIAFGGGTTGITYAVQSGSYTRVGRLTTITCIIVLSNKGSSTGGVTVTGLPFTSASGLQYVSQGSVSIDGITFSGQVEVQIGSNKTYIDVQQTTVVGTRSNLQNTNFSNSSEIAITVSYVAA